MFACGNPPGCMGVRLACTLFDNFRDFAWNETLKYVQQSDGKNEFQKYYQKSDFQKQNKTKQENKKKKKPVW